MTVTRKAQQEILKYRSGRMGVSAVPGSGKTYTLSRLAASIIGRQALDDDQEVLIVTLVNSAVDNFSARISGMIGSKGFFPNLGYRVRTLHGLAHDIVRGRPALVDLEPDFKIIDEPEAQRICQEAAQAWIKTHPGFFEQYIKADLDDYWQAKIRNEKIPELVEGIALGVIRTAKDAQKSPADLKTCLDALPVPLELAEMGVEIYNDYQRALKYRAAVDFDDLIRLALAALEADDKYLQRLQHTWPYILEDEAQDSSRLQEEILKKLAGENGNWVRVGDPNQAIYETFTTASPKYLKQFIQRQDVQSRDLPQSGRSTPSIIQLANHLIDWTMASHPLHEVRDALTLPHIQPTDPGDPQPNPTDAPERIHILYRTLTPEKEIRLVADSIERWQKDHPDETAAVLSPRNTRGVDMVNELRKRKIEFVEILKSTDSTRRAAGALAHIMIAVADPKDLKKLGKAYFVWRRDARQDPQSSDKVKRTLDHLHTCRNVEEYLWPKPGQDWLEDSAVELDPQICDELVSFREKAQRWHGAALLPVDQAVLTLAQDLFTEPSDLAVAHKLAIALRQAHQTHDSWRLPELSNELAVIAKNERKFIGLSEEERGFNPDDHKGKVVITTIHKAKGLEWDRVYLLSVNAYDFPSGAQTDQYIAEPWFFHNKVNLSAEALEQLRVVLEHGDYDWYEPGAATQRSRQEYISERLRLLYVGITRAKKELIITWNNGRREDVLPSAAFLELEQYWREVRGAGLEQVG